MLVVSPAAWQPLLEVVVLAAVKFVAAVGTVAIAFVVAVAFL